MKFINLISSAIIASSTSIITTSFLHNKITNTNPKHHFNNNFKQNNDKDWANVNLNDFIVPSHYLTLNSSHQSNDPSQADININLTSNSESLDILIISLGEQLDNRYKIFETKYNLSDNMFQIETGNPANLGTEFDILDQNTKIKTRWKPDILHLTPGHWASYNLTFKNLLNNTSFNFSLNLTNFVTKMPNFTIANSDATLPSMYYHGIPNGFHPLQASSHITSQGPNDMTAIDFTKPIIDLANSNRLIGTFNNATSAGFFLKPLQYQFRFDTSQLWGNNTYNHHIVSTQTATINLSKLSSNTLMNMMDLPYKYVDNKKYVEFNLAVLQSYDYYHNNTMSSVTHFSHGQMLSTDDIVTYFKSIDNTQLLINNATLSDASGDAEGHGFYLNFVTYGTSLTGSYNTSIFNNSAYSFDNFNPAQIILAKITKTSILYSSTLPSDISNSSAQKSLINLLNGLNNNILTTTQMADYKITLNFGSNNLIMGNNPATLKLTFYGYQASLNININWKTAQAFNKINKIINQGLIINQSARLEYMGGIYVNPYKADKHINTNDPRAMKALINSVGLNDGIANMTLLLTKIIVNT